MGRFDELKKLQSIDSEIDSLETKRASLPEIERLEALQVELTKLQNNLSKIEKELKEEERKQKKMEGELDLVSLKIDKEEKKLYSGTIANPKELASIQEEIKVLKNQNDEQETRLLEELDVVDNLKKEVSELTSQIDDLSAERSEVDKKYKEVAAEIDAQLGKLRNERRNVVPNIEESILSLYEDLRKTKQGLAVVQLKDGVCQGCHMELPAEEVDKMLHSDDLWQCDNCKRIIVS